MTTPQEDCFNLAAIHCKEEFNYLDLDSLKSDQNPVNWTYGTKQEMINWHAVSQEDQWNFCSPDEKTYHTLQPSGWKQRTYCPPLEINPNMDVENPYDNYDPLFKCAEALMRNSEPQRPQYGQTGEYHKDLNAKDDPHHRLLSPSTRSNYISQNDKIHGNFQVKTEQFTEQDRYENLRIKPEPKIVKIIKGSRINGDDEVVVLGEYKGSSVPAYRGHLKTNSNGEQYLELTRGSSPKKVTLLKTPGKVLKLGPLSPVRGVTKKCSIIMKNICNENKSEIGKPKHIILTSPPQLPNIMDKQVLRVSPIKYIRVAPLQTLTGRTCENEGHSRTSAPESYIAHAPKEVWVKSHDQDKQPFPTMTSGIHKIKDFKKDAINVPITYKILANGLLSASPHNSDKRSGGLDISNELAVNIQKCEDSKARNSDNEDSKCTSKDWDAEDTQTTSDERKKDSCRQSAPVEDSVRPPSPRVPRVAEVKKLVTIMKTEDESTLVSPQVQQNHDALIVRSDTKVTAEVLAAASCLKVVGRAGTGVDNINIEAATRKGVIVLNTPGGNSTSACELTCALISALARNIPQACQSLKEGRWDRKLYTGNELAGKTLAVLGLGRIGREVAARMQAFGMRTIGFDPMVTAEVAQAFHVEKMELTEIWPQADYITVHTPLIPQTRNLLNDEVFGRCKPGVRIVNVARGGIVDEDALLRALKDGRCAAAALDVFCEEPPKSPGTLELIQHPKVIVTPHLGASTHEAQQRVAVEIAEQFIALASNVDPQVRARYSITGVVNAPVLAAAMVRGNTPWITLAKELGTLAAKMTQGVVPGTKIQITTSGAAMEGQKFVSAAVLAGMLSGYTKNGLNLINAPILAQEAGIQISVHHEDTEGPGTVKVTVSRENLGSRSLRGTVKADDLPYLLSVDDANFEQGVLIGNNVQLFQGRDSLMNLGTIVSELISRGANITSVATAMGKNAWFAVRTERRVEDLNISGVITF